MTHQETEVKLYIPDIENMRQRIVAAGATVIQERVHERNVRYDTETKNLSSRGIVLRLREDVGIQLTYKGQGTIDRGIVSREELEVEVSDYDTMELILKRLGYEPVLFYEKYRAIYHLGDVHIMLDEMPFGNFVEIEGSNVAIEAALDKLDLQDVDRREYSYAKLFDFVKHHLELDFRDLTFENFHDVDVPENAFIPPGSIVIR